MWLTSYLRPAIVALLALAALLGGNTPASAATFTVTKTADTNDGVCDGDCSLREAIGAANAAAGADTINLPTGTYTLSIAGAGEDANISGDLDIGDDLTINGAGAATIIDGGGLDRVLHILSGVTVETSALTIQGGFILGTGAGAGIRNSGDATLTNVTVSGNKWGGGIANLGTLTLHNSTVSDNTFGGGIDNLGTLTLHNSAVSGNLTYGVGGGIRNSGDATLNSSTVSGNTGGGGIANFAGTLTLHNSTVSGNTTGGVGGGGIRNSGNATLTNVTVSGNSSASGGVGGQGGGIYNLGTLTLHNSTVSGNTSGGGGGGAIFNRGDATLTNVTVSGNSTSASAGIFSAGGGIRNSGNATLTNVTVSGNSTNGTGGGISNTGDATLKSTIVANSVSGGDCSGTITSIGNNLSSDGACGFTAPGDIQNTNPLLGPLADNGGPTQTHALLSSSPAIDAVPIADCTDVLGNPVSTDQRGVARPQGAACDIGAFERAFEAGSDSDKTFCILGQSTGAGWTWTLQGTGLPDQTVGVPGLAVGSTAEQMTQAWVVSINGAQGAPPVYSAAVEPVGSNCFTVAAALNFSFSVDGCVITSRPAGCSFNPVVTQVSPSFSPVGGIVELRTALDAPAEASGSSATGGYSAPIVAAAAVGAIALAAGGWYARGRFRQRRI